MRNSKPPKRPLGTTPAMERALRAQMAKSSVARKDDAIKEVNVLPARGLMALGRQAIASGLRGPVRPVNSKEIADMARRYAEKDKKVLEDIGKLTHRQQQMVRDEIARQYKKVTPLDKLKTIAKKIDKKLDPANTGRTGAIGIGIDETTNPKTVQLQEVEIMKPKKYAVGGKSKIVPDPKKKMPAHLTTSTKPFKLTQGTHDKETTSTLEYLAATPYNAKVANELLAVANSKIKDPNQKLQTYTKDGRVLITDNKKEGENWMNKTGKYWEQDQAAPKKMAQGGSLKPVPAGKKGLAKLPTEVRNKMGYMMGGGKLDMMYQNGGQNKLVLDRNMRVVSPTRQKLESAAAAQKAAQTEKTFNRNARLDREAMLTQERNTIKKNDPDALAAFDRKLKEMGYKVQQVKKMAQGGKLKKPGAPNPLNPTKDNNSYISNAVDMSPSTKKQMDALRQAMMYFTGVSPKNK